MDMRIQLVTYLLGLYISMALRGLSGVINLCLEIEMTGNGGKIRHPISERTWHNKKEKY